ncbi:MAG TPA: DUF1844 domain-containing protein [Candidatus Binataceae bacterium]|nr:DUF1844 domain-containing protein [Candidatus Binataceae bacterium]
MGRSEEESSKGFKVQDRRRFSAEGELKPEFSGGEEAPADQPKTASPEATAEAGRAPSSAGPPGAEASSGAEPSAFVHGQPPPAAELTFGTFLMSLSTEALIHLGEMPDPVAGERHRDLASAQQLIDILGMLREKTRGNLERDEQALLDAILFDLRMKYVEIARQAG